MKTIFVLLAITSGGVFLTLLSLFSLKFTGHREWLDNVAAFTFWAGIIIALMGIIMVSLAGASLFVVWLVQN